MGKGAKVWLYFAERFKNCLWGMGRKSLIRVPNLPYHVTARSNNREWFYAPQTEVWKTFDTYLVKIQDKFEIKIHAFVLMSNHFHLLITTPQANLDIVMKYLQREVCRNINRSVGRINHLFGGPYKWSLIHTEQNYLHALKYIYRNPVKAGLCHSVENYPFSSLVTKNFKFQISSSTFEIFSEVDNLTWLNTVYTAEEDDCVRRALRRKEFKFSPQRRKKALPELFQESAK